MEIIKLKNFEEVSKKAFSLISAKIISKPDCVLGLATGSSPIKVYELFIKAYKDNILDFSNVKTINLDEYYKISPNEKQSYYYFMMDKLFNHINIDKNNINIPNGNTDNIDEECKRYEKKLEFLGYADLQLLGIGHNGHIGFNEPSEFFDNDVHLTNLSESTINANSRLFNSVDEVPRQAITMGIGSIMRSKKIILIANSDKSEIIKKISIGKIDPQIPASILQLHPDVTIITC